MGEFAATVWRIGLMGPNATRTDALLVLAALDDALANASRLETTHLPGNGVPAR